MTTAVDMTPQQQVTATSNSRFSQSRRSFRKPVSRAISLLSPQKQVIEEQQFDKIVSSEKVSTPSRTPKTLTHHSSKRKNKKFQDREEEQANDTKQRQTEKWGSFSRAVSMFSKQSSRKQSLLSSTKVISPANKSLEGSEDSICTPKESFDTVFTSSISSHKQNHSPTSIKYDFFDDDELLQKDHDLLSLPVVSLTKTPSPLRTNNHSPSAITTPTATAKSLNKPPKRTRLPSNDIIDMKNENEQLKLKIEKLEMAAFEKDVLENEISYLEFVLDELRNEAEEYNECALEVLSLTAYENHDDEFSERHLDSQSFC